MERLSELTAADVSPEFQPGGRRSRELARETARYNINVNCVCPGPTETPLLVAVPEKHLEAFKKAIPFRRFGKPSEIADAVVFFASDRASYITGQVLSVSGGLTMVG
jgi:2-hydroxycyclohexanecarboxyl-CoA dehydrogenase